MLSALLALDRTLFFLSYFFSCSPSCRAGGLEPDGPARRWGPGCGSRLGCVHRGVSAPRAATEKPPAPKFSMLAAAQGPASTLPCSNSKPWGTEASLEVARKSFKNKLVLGCPMSWGLWKGAQDSMRRVEGYGLSKGQALHWSSHEQPGLAPCHFRWLPHGLEGGSQPPKTPSCQVG